MNPNGSSLTLLTMVLPSYHTVPHMGIKQKIQVDGQDYWTLFDTGSRNTYVVSSLSKVLNTSPMAHAFRTEVSSEERETRASAILEAKIEGRPISTHAFVLDEIGRDENGTRIEILFGALAMQQWGIRPTLGEERLDLTQYPEVFVEF